MALGRRGDSRRLRGALGAERFSKPLKKARQQWGLTAVVGGSFVRLAAASSEIGINVVSAVRGVSDIGLGVMFGSNIVVIPLMVTTASSLPRRNWPKSTRN